jgi:hypothetical protein
VLLEVQWACLRHILASTMPFVVVSDIAEHAAGLCMYVSDWFCRLVLSINVKATCLVSSCTVQLAHKLIKQEPKTGAARALS